MKVKIKTWEEMLLSGGVLVIWNEQQAIQFPSGVVFTKDLEHDLPKDRVINVVLGFGKNIQDYLINLYLSVVLDFMLSMKNTFEDIKMRVKMLKTQLGIKNA